MSTTETGRQAESAVARYLQQHGFIVIEHNWRTRWCEIDVVAQKAETIYFVEVKYRQSNRQGDGLEYIINKKYKQMSFAAELWVLNHKWNGEYCLAAASVSGDDYKTINFIEL